MLGQNFAEVDAGKAAVFQQCVDFVTENFEALLARRFFAQVARQQVTEAELPALGVFDEQAAAPPGFDALLQLDGFIFASDC
ncbi:hypothetical protein FQZ97_1094020 [compost metagenome]